jgi:SAM-dependent methyltransferase
MNGMESRAWWETDALDVHALFRDWIGMHASHNPWRSLEVAVILNLLRTLPIEDLTVLDLACGAGGLSESMLRTFGGLRVVGIDSNPFLLHVGREHLRPYAPRISLIRADIRRDLAFQDIGKVQVAASMTSLHWLSREHLLQLYRRLYDLLPPGGIFVNGDRIRLSDPWFESIDNAPAGQAPPESWEGFWRKVEEASGAPEEVRRMNSSAAVREGGEEYYPRDFYLNSLKWAGFPMAEVLFQAGNRIVYCGRKG